MFLLLFAPAILWHYEPLQMQCIYVFNIKKIIKEYTYISGIFLCAVCWRCHSILFIKCLTEVLDFRNHYGNILSVTFKEKLILALNIWRRRHTGLYQILLIRQWHFFSLLLLSVDEIADNVPTLGEIACQNSSKFIQICSTFITLYIYQIVTSFFPANGHLSRAKVYKIETCQVTTSRHICKFSNVTHRWMVIIKIKWNFYLTKNC